MICQAEENNSIALMASKDFDQSQTYTKDSFLKLADDTTKSSNADTSTLHDPMAVKQQRNEPAALRRSIAFSEEENTRQSSAGSDNAIKEEENGICIRDFAFHTSDPRHWGEPAIEEEEETEPTRVSLVSEDSFCGQYARALYDFEAEFPQELGFCAGDILFIQYRQGEGWFVADHCDSGETGLVPENYVDLLGEDYEYNDGGTEQEK
ncbi:uncharacterized protein VTP21DRAFT_6618 [Calcarisporiella thermophila]|uniref:uncharacterized protein n=1 Tax=Calcarisporiella thermophila TaxID=911321 RepID=UPI00374286A3